MKLQSLTPKSVRTIFLIDEVRGHYTDWRKCEFCGEDYEDGLSCECDKAQLVAMTEERDYWCKIAGQRQAEIVDLRRAK